MIEKTAPDGELVAAGFAPFFPQFAIVAMLVAIRYIVVTTGTRMLVD